MKTNLKMAVLLLFGAVILQSCTKVDEPYYTVKSSVNVDTTKRSVLLEDYTGHQCVNCAPAAKIANTIQAYYPGQVFVIAIHAGSFARPNPVSYPPYLLPDYRCTTGNDWNGFSSFNIDAYPKGMVNRRPYKGSTSFGTSEWNQAVQEAIALPKVAVMTVNNSFNSQTKLLNSKVDVKFLTSYSGMVNLTVCILEDSIYGGQLNIIPPDSTPIIKNFRFMHMLRGSLNGSFGEEIAVNPSSGLLATRSFTFDFSAQSWVPEHCSVIAFISDAETKEVLHVAKSADLR
ncbi:MAG: Omp28-related outer membrane protein [Bacteroidetes bacterium]|nr:Omp28-related outer membrane protein [Bacteroidota bacterium]